eukprot:CAMPEP_0170630894 /NCGR_PEP_ID=MMETSP0224-20130122/34286_1 /TAXON_ID=285029 /ORGANISM="Togula jolla, Strain CCCM 725" /LENGTH=211 /DNA_ID=CAMNT_0010959067 /DNA_START=82 /DNA_END=717 /DNA_ORIENTATION=-
MVAGTEGSPSDMPQGEHAEVDGIMATPERRAKRRRDDVHVQWDEETIAEHDKERGTRQKIDEPPTPFVRSPEAASDDEGEKRLSPGKDAFALEEKIDPDQHGVAAWLEEMVAENPFQPSRPATEVAADLAADKAQEPSGRSSESEGQHAPAGVPDSRDTGSLRVQLSDDTGPKPSSASFRAKRARHYDEFKVLKRLREQENDASSGEEAAK